MPSATQRLHAPISVRSVDREKLTVDFVVSTDSLDSYGTRIDQAGWELEQFKRNPVITWAHDDRGFTPSGGLPVANGIPETVRVENGALVMRMRFTPEDVNPFGYRVFRLIEAGFLHGSSVGFDPVKWEDIDEEDGEGGTRKVRWFRRQKLVEVAMVTIPSNDEALARRAKEMNRENQIEEIRQWAQEVETMAKGKIDSEEYEKYRSYFEKKQPANKAATKALEKFFKVRGLTQPDDEVEAWKRMAAIIEDEEEEEKKEEEEEKKEKAKEETVTATATTEVTVEEPVLPSTPAEEAPQPERKASVQLSLPTLLSLRDIVKKTCVDAGVEALRRGVPRDELDGFIEAVGRKFYRESISK